MPGSKNVLLIIVDCLRYDYAEDPKKMPFLASWGTHFHRHWSTSHCTDPAITHMLFGRHPDELKLYSMMYNDKSFNLDPDLHPVMRLARDNEYWTSIITNLGRWYHRGTHMAYNCRGWSSQQIFDKACKTINHFPGRWMLVVHTDAMHTNYEGGSYDEAARITDTHIENLVKTCVGSGTLCIVTSDHGEGLGQAGPDGVAIAQHGYGLWDFLTHVPFITNLEVEDEWTSWCTDPGAIYRLMRDTVLCNEWRLTPGNPIFQAGATPKAFHRGVVDWDRHFIRSTTKQGQEYFRLGYGLAETAEDIWAQVELALAEHCASYDIEYGEMAEYEQVVIDRLKGLGYWPE